MKKHFALLLTVFSVLIILCACNNTEKTDTTTADTTSISAVVSTEAPTGNPATTTQTPTVTETIKTESVTFQPTIPVVDDIYDENKVEVEWVDDYDPFDE